MWDGKSSPHRVLRNSTYERWEAAGAPASAERPGEGEEVAAGIPRYASNPPLAGLEGDIQAMAMYAGQSVGTITAVEPAVRSWNASSPGCARTSLSSTMVKPPPSVRCRPRAGPASLVLTRPKAIVLVAARRPTVSDDIQARGRKGARRLYLPTCAMRKAEVSALLLVQPSARRDIFDRPHAIADPCVLEVDHVAAEP